MGKDRRLFIFLLLLLFSPESRRDRHHRRHPVITGKENVSFYHPQNKEGARMPYLVIEDYPLWQGRLPTD